MEILVTLDTTTAWPPPDGSKRQNVKTFGTGSKGVLLEYYTGVNVPTPNF